MDLAALEDRDREHAILDVIDEINELLAKTRALNGTQSTTSAPEAVDSMMMEWVPDATASKDYDGQLNYVGKEQGARADDR